MLTSGRTWSTWAAVALLAHLSFIAEASGEAGAEQLPVEASNDTRPAGSSRGGRMLDLEVLAGELGRDAKAARERSVSGARQSRTLADQSDSSEGGGGWAPEAGAEQQGRQARARKLSISGFIPIVSLEQASSLSKSGLAKQLLGDSEGEPGADSSAAAGSTSGEDTSGAEQQAGRLREQMAAQYGGSTSIGHASFASEAPDQYQQQQSSPSSSPPPSDRANRKLSQLGANLGANLALLSQAPRRLLGQAAPEPDCMCVPFFQCKNGFLQESQLSRSQLRQIAAHQAQQVPPQLPAYAAQVPRALPGAELAYASANSLWQAAGASEQPSRPAADQIAGDIYEQLAKRIESEKLEQQLQQQLQQQQQQQPQQPPTQQAYQLMQQLDERQAPANSSAADSLEGRNAWGPLAARRQAGSCGLMRTCCRLPASLQRGRLLGPQWGPARPQLQQLLQPAANQQTSGLQLYPQAAASQPVYQQLTGSQPAYLQTGSQPAYLQTGSPPAYLQTGGPLQPQAAPESAEAAEAGAGSAPPPGSLMAGRCGLRPALGIAGRVQNAAPAAGDSSLADFGEFPAHAAILRRLGPQDSLFVCSAALVSHQWLATAAHCVRKLRPQELKVRLGEWDVARDDEMYPHLEAGVRQILVHPDFQPASLANDLALVRIDTSGAELDAAAAPHIGPACLAGPDEGSLAGQRCWLAGWGKDAFGRQGSFQSQLTKVDLQVLSNRDCELALRHNTKLGPHFRLHPSALCAGGERGKDACEGDGGAGLYCQPGGPAGPLRLAGLVSWGVGCGQAGVPGVYTRLQPLAAWIERAVLASQEPGAFGGAGAEGELFKALVSERSAAQNATKPA